MATTIEKMVKFIHEEVRPGEPWAFNEAASVGDGVWQGDLGLELVGQIPEGYTEVKNPTVQDRQLVPGNTQGARHCLSHSKVRLFRPEQWGEESLLGPAFEVLEAVDVLHPTHGRITIPAGFVVLCRYQRVWDQEQRRERRSRD